MLNWQIKNTVFLPVKGRLMHFPRGISWRRPWKAEVTSAPLRYLNKLNTARIIMVSCWYTCSSLPSFWSNMNQSCLSTPGWIYLVCLHSALVHATFSVLNLHIICIQRLCSQKTSLQNSWGSFCPSDTYCKGILFHWISSKVQIPGYKVVWTLCCDRLPL